MKTLAKIFALVVIMSTTIMAQDDTIAKFFSKYDSDESFSKVNVSSKMFSLMANIDVDDPQQKTIVNAISKIKGLKILRKENTRHARELYKEALSAVPIRQFEELMTIRDKDQDVRFFTKEAGGEISELLMVMCGSEEFMVMSLFGEIDLKEIGKIGKSIQIDGLQNLEKIKK